MSKRSFVHIVAVVLLTWQLASCGTTQQTNVVEPTVTPVGTSVPPSLNGSVLSSEPQADLMLAEQQIAAGQYADAIRILHHLNTQDANAAQPLFAQAYLNWGRSIVQGSTAHSDIESARERFINGLALAPASQELRAELANTDVYLAIAQKIEQLRLANAEEDTERANTLATELMPQLSEIRQRAKDFGSFAALAYDGFLACGSAFIANNQRDQARSAFEQAVGIPGMDTEFARAELEKLREPTPTPTRVAPTPPPRQLVVVPDVRGADPGAAKSFLEAQGFQVALTQITDPAQLIGLCKQMVSYTAPQGGSRVDKGSLVRIFYRGFDNYSSPANCPPGR